MKDDQEERVEVMAAEGGRIWIVGDEIMSVRRAKTIRNKLDRLIRKIETQPVAAAPEIP